MAEKNKKKDELKKENEKRKKKQDERESELEKMLRQVEEQFGIDRSQVRIVKVNTPPKNLKSILVDAIMTIIINLILLLSISGYLEWAKYDNILDLVWFILTFTIIELLLKYLINFSFHKTVVRTFGLILSISTLLAIPLVLIFSSFVQVISVERLLFMFIILIIVRSMVKNFILKRKLKKFFHHRGK